MEDQFNLFEDIASIDTSQGTKICTICKQEKAVTSFERASYRKDGTLVYKNQCIKCIHHHRIFRKEIWKENSPPDNHVCPICLRNNEELLADMNPQSTVRQTWVADHDHNLMQFRGWLCSKCNMAMGGLDDDIKLLENAIKYLKENQNNS